MLHLKWVRVVRLATKNSRKNISGYTTLAGNEHCRAYKNGMCILQHKCDRSDRVTARVQLKPAWALESDYHLRLYLHFSHSNMGKFRRFFNRAFRSTSSRGSQAIVVISPSSEELSQTQPALRLPSVPDVGNNLLQNDGSGAIYHGSPRKNFRIMTIFQPPEAFKPH